MGPPLDGRDVLNSVYGDHALIVVRKGTCGRRVSQRVSFGIDTKFPKTTTLQEHETVSSSLRVWIFASEPLIRTPRWIVGCMNFNRKWGHVFHCQIEQIAESIGGIRIVDPFTQILAR